MTELHCPKGSSVWNWAIENGYESILVDWDGIDPTNPDGELTFKMMQKGKEVSSILVGTEVNFEVSTPDSTSYVQLVIGDEPYETYEVSNNKALFNRVIHSIGEGEGIRKIQIQAVSENGNVTISFPRNLTVTSYGILTEPEFTLNSERNSTGEPIKVKFDMPDNVDNWYIWVYE